MEKKEYYVGYVVARSKNHPHTKTWLDFVKSVNTDFFSAVKEAEKIAKEKEAKEAFVRETKMYSRVFYFTIEEE